MSTILRIAAAYSLLWAVFLFWPGWWPGDPAPVTPGMRSMGRGLAMANLAIAVLLWRAASDPRRERWIVYAALLLFGLRAAIGTYDVLYTLEGDAAALRLADMVISLAGFTGMLNSLPGVLQPEK